MNVTYEKYGLQLVSNSVTLNDLERHNDSQTLAIRVVAKVLSGM